MFDFLFGGKRKIDLIRELLEQRMREGGFDDLESRLKVKALGNLELVGTPEGAIVTIIETTIKMQKQGALLGQILSSMENHRKRLGEDHRMFKEILNISRGAEAGASVPMYIHYRVGIEAPGRMSDDQINRAIEQTIQAFS
jgi:hypothetical protein